MSHKKCHWNLPKNKINKIAYDTISELLEDKKKIDINELISSLNIKTRNFIFKKNNNKSTNITTYLKIEFGSFTKFIDLHDKFGICNSNGKIYIILNKKSYIDEFSDWIVVNDDF
tara:strand:- start:372 stop:716 length:345 start_codon:yes stop_codon:yes gene_type:complete